MAPVRWHRDLGTAVLVAMPPSFLVLPNQEMPACRQVPKVLAQGLLSLVVPKESIAEMLWDARAVVGRHTLRGISVWTHYGGRPAGACVRHDARS